MAEQKHSLAEALFRTARAEMKAGNYADACPKLDESYRLDPAQGTLLNKAVCEEGLGRSATAWADYTRFVEAARPNDERLALAQARIRELEPNVPRLRIVVRGAPPSALLHLDGIELQSASIGVEIPVDPGEHEATVIVPDGRRAEQTTSVAVGEHVLVELKLPSAEPELAPAIVPKTALPRRSERAATPLPTHSESPSRGLLIAGYTVAGVGAAGFVAAGVLTLVALDKKSVVAKHCPNRICDDTGFGAAQDGERLLRAADIGLVIGAAGFAVGGFLLFKDSTAKPKLAASAHSIVAAIEGMW